MNVLQLASGNQTVHLTASKIPAHGGQSHTAAICGKRLFHGWVMPAGTVEVTCSKCRDKV